LNPTVFEHVLCDLDGTLVDSSAGILDTLRSCLHAAGRRSSVDISERLIGPPLRTMIETVLDTSDAAAIDEVEAAYCREYDQSGYLATQPYPGIAEALFELRAQGMRLHIVTNKRRLPTLRILDMLGWSEVFETVSTLGAGAPGATKTGAVAKLVTGLHTPATSIALVGDSLDDAIAARDNGLCFAWASWGFGKESVLAALGVPVVDAGHLVQFLLGEEAVGVDFGT
jgi:phosphoglycolate phosphatase